MPARRTRYCSMRTRLKKGKVKVVEEENQNQRRTLTRRKSRTLKRKRRERRTERQRQRRKSRPEFCNSFFSRYPIRRDKPVWYPNTLYISVIAHGSSR